jgi:ribose-phosphate pyrophosphokinase
MEIRKYPDNTSYSVITDLSKKEFTFRINSYKDLWHLGQIIEAFNHNNIKPIVTIPNLIDAQADKRFENNQSFGLGLVAKWLNLFKVEKYKLFHPHNPEVAQALINNSEIIDNTEYIKIVLSKIDTSNCVLMSSDAGGFKPLIKLCDKINWKGETYSASKSRSWDEIDGTKFTQVIDRTDFNGKDVVIIDDVSVYGGTFKGLAKLLKDKNIGKLYLVVSHMTVQELGQFPVTDFFTKVFTTNSKFDEYYGRDDYEPKNLEVIKLF